MSLGSCPSPGHINLSLTLITNLSLTLIAPGEEPPHSELPGDEEGLLAKLRYAELPHCNPNPNLALTLTLTQTLTLTPGVP